MRKCDVRNINDAFLYLADCQLATVDGMALIKSRKKSEYIRQISIAQSFIEWIKQYNLNIDTGSRVYNVLATKSQTVEEYVKKFEVI